jgi:SH3 domain-containing YSC84-like protein 1
MQNAFLVVPDLIKGGFIIGGKHGRGVATCRTTDGWSAPAVVSVGGGSWGLQIGVEGVDLVMLVMNDQGFQHLLSSKFELTGEGSVAAGPVGRHASAGTDWKMNTEMSDLLAFESRLRRSDPRGSGCPAG